MPTGYLFIHIGYPKTGTTTIQGICHENRVKLDNGFNTYYPVSACDPVSFGHHNLFWSLNWNGIPHHLKIKNAGGWEELYHETKRLPNKKNILISSESFSRLFVIYPERVTSLINDLSIKLNKRVKLIICLREAVDYHESMFFHRLKAWHHGVNDHQIPSYKALISRIINNPSSYLNILLNAIRTFPYSSLIFYDRNHLIEHFFDSIGLKEAFDKLEITNSNKNKRMAQPLVTLVYLISQLQENLKYRKNLIDNYAEIRKLFNIGNEKYHLFGDEEKNIIRNKMIKKYGEILVRPEIQTYKSDTNTIFTKNLSSTKTLNNPFFLDYPFTSEQLKCISDLIGIDSNFISLLQK